MPMIIRSVNPTTGTIQVFFFTNATIIRPFILNAVSRKKVAVDIKVAIEPYVQRL